VKVEKFISPKAQSIKVHLKNGKVVDLPGEKIPQLATASAATILQAAGIQPVSLAVTPDPNAPAVKGKSQKDQ
jgi:hypothetical protein